MNWELYEQLKASTSKDPVGQLQKAILIYDNELAQGAASKIAEEGKDPLKAMDAMIAAIGLIGDGFGSGDLFLPDLVGAAAAMSAATPIIEEELKKRGAHRKGLGTVVIGTVFGDIHDIGKNMVATFLRAEGFVVHDISINVRAEGFIEAVKEYNADILAMSALLTTTAPEMRRVISGLKSEGLREKTKVIVGGGAITKAFADAIGADGYGPTAPGGPALARKLMGR